MVATGNRRGIDWNYWTNLQWVRVFDACALSLGIDPRSFDSDKRYYDFGPGANDRPGGGGGVSRITQIRTMEELNKRREMLSQALISRRHFSAPLPGMRLGKDVLLSEFASWIAQLNREPTADGLLRAIGALATSPSLAVAIPEPGVTTHPIRPVFDRAPDAAPVMARAAGADNHSTSLPISPKGRRNVLDSTIETAIKQATAPDTATVWICLRALALNSTEPFSGTIREPDGALQYTNAKSEINWLTKKALGDRLRRRRSNRSGHAPAHS